jgi:catechol 2,3-dioxygenase-like lactoylglutathione lyase family enzyme
MLTNRPAHATLPATDLSRARAFYECKLGFKPSLDMPGGVMYDTGGTRFLVYPSGGKPSGEHTQMGFTVDDIAAEVAELKQRGIEFLEYDVPGLKTENSIATTGPVKSAWFEDPEGNLIGLVQFSM